MPTQIDITTLQSIAEHYGGKCLSKEYIDEHTSLEWICEKGHRWESPYKVVNQGGWCMQCLRKYNKSKSNLKEINQIVFEKGGKCLSTEYKGNLEKLEFECAEGHHWETTPKSIKKGHWCNICRIKKAGELRKDSIETYHKIAAEKGGKCLSNEYISKYLCFQNKTNNPRLNTFVF